MKHKTIQRTTSHHMTYVHTYMHTLRYDESTRPGGMREAIKSAAPCLPGEQLRVGFRPSPAIWQLPVLEHSPSGPAHSAGHFNVRSRSWGVFAPKSLPKSSAILSCVLNPPEATLDWFSGASGVQNGDQNGAKYLSEMVSAGDP